MALQVASSSLSEPLRILRVYRNTRRCFCQAHLTIDKLCGSTERSIRAVEQTIEQLESQQAKFQENVMLTLQAILGASQMSDVERSSAKDARRTSAIQVAETRTLATQLGE
jgi:hypothetical protein